MKIIFPEIVGYDTKMEIDIDVAANTENPWLQARLACIEGLEYLKVVEEILAASKSYYRNTRATLVFLEIILDKHSTKCASQIKLLQEQNIEPSTVDFYQAQIAWNQEARKQLADFNQQLDKSVADDIASSEFEEASMNAASVSTQQEHVKHTQTLSLSLWDAHGLSSYKAKINTIILNHNILHSSDEYNSEELRQLWQIISTNLLYEAELTNFVLEKLGDREEVRLMLKDCRLLSVQKLVV